MNREILIKDTLYKIQQLPDLRIQEINDFAEFLLSKIDDKILVEGIQKLTSNSKSFKYLMDEEDLYSVNDIKRKIQVKKGEIVLIPFPYSDLTGNKLRPAVILISSKVDVTVCFITTQIQWKDKYDFELISSSFNGLKKDSIIRIGKLATIDKEIVLGSIGKLEANYILLLNNNLAKILQLK